VPEGALEFAPLDRAGSNAVAVAARAVASAALTATATLGAASAVLGRDRAQTEAAAQLAQQQQQQQQLPQEGAAPKASPVAQLPQPSPGGLRLSAGASPAGAAAAADLRTSLAALPAAAHASPAAAGRPGFDPTSLRISPQSFMSTGRRRPQPGAGGGPVAVGCAGGGGVPSALWFGPRRAASGCWPWAALRHVRIAAGWLAAQPLRPPRSLLPADLSLRTHVEANILLVRARPG
jgi:hypothetical protein